MEQVLCHQHQVPTSAITGIMLNSYKRFDVEDAVSLIASICVNQQQVASANLSRCQKLRSAHRYSMPPGVLVSDLLNDRAADEHYQIFKAILVESHSELQLEDIENSA